MLSNKLKSFNEAELFSFMAEEPLLAYLFVRTDVIEDDRLPYYAGIQTKSGRIILRLNPKKFALLEFKERIGILVHEYLHILFGHCTGRAITNSAKIVKQNIAQDMIINQLVLDSGVWSLPEEGVAYNKGIFNYKPNLSSDEYFKLIDSDFSDEEIEEAFGGPSMESHGGWEETGSENSSLIRDLLKDYARTNSNGVGETLGKSRQHSNLVERVLVSDVSPEWISEAKRYLARKTPSGRRRTYKRPSKRFGFPAKGTLLKRTEKAIAIIDTSLSMKESYLKYILGSLNRLSGRMSIDAIMCDNKINDNVIKKFRPSDELDFRGRGGTDLQPAFDYAKVEGYKSIICFTDGGFKKRLNSQLKTVWVCINNREFKPVDGLVCHVNWD